MNKKIIKTGNNFKANSLKNIPFTPNTKILKNSNVITRPSLPFIKQWTNGIYSYNNNFMKNLPFADLTVHKLIKNFFAAKPLASNGKITRLVIRKILRLGFDKIFVSKPEIKHFSDKINITVFLYNKKKNIILKDIMDNVNSGLFKLKINIDKLFKNKFKSRNFKSKYNKTILLKSVGYNKNKLKNIKFKPYLFTEPNNLSVISKTLHKYLKFRFINTSVNKGLKSIAFIPSFKSLTSNKITYNVLSKKSKAKHNHKTLLPGLNKGMLPFKGYSLNTVSSNKNKGLKASHYNNIMVIYKKLLIGNIKACLYNSNLLNKSFNTRFNSKNLKHILQSKVMQGNKSLIYNKPNNLNKFLLSNGYKKNNILALPKLTCFSKDKIMLDYFFNKYFKHFNSNTLNNVKNQYYLNYLDTTMENNLLALQYLNLLTFNNSLFKSWLLTPLNSIISRLYNKQVVFNFINIKYLYLNSDLLAQAIVLKLKDIRVNKLNKVLKNVLNLMLISKINPYTQDILNPTYKLVENHFSRFKRLNNIIFDRVKPTTFNSNINSKPSVFKPEYLNTLPITSTGLNRAQVNTLRFIKYRSVFGLKLEVAGRLTKRSTASRSVFRIKFIGNLRNKYHVTRIRNPRIIKSNIISNLQYSRLESKTRNGSFGIKTWINNS